MRYIVNFDLINNHNFLDFLVQLIKNIVYFSLFSIESSVNKMCLQKSIIDLFQ